MEAENFLAGGYAIRAAIEARAGWGRLGELANVWQPSRLKGIQVSAENGTPFLAATQVFDTRPIPRKWLAVARTTTASDRFVEAGQILVTCSGSVGRAIVAQRFHEGVLISHDLLRVAPRNDVHRGWLYAFLRSQAGRDMMVSSQYGHIIKHLEPHHLDAIPVPSIRAGLLEAFDAELHELTALRDRASNAIQEAESLFEQRIGLLPARDSNETGFSIAASRIQSKRRRFEAAAHRPYVRALRTHLTHRATRIATLPAEGYRIWLPARFKRVAAREGLGFLDSADLFEVNPDITKRIADGGFGDPFKGRVTRGWLLLARSGQIYGVNGSVTMATAAHEGAIVSDHIMRIAPSESSTLRSGYLFVALAHPTLGQPLLKSLAYGSSIPEIDPLDVVDIPIARIEAELETNIADLVDEAFRLRGEADSIENRMAARAGEIIDRVRHGDLSDVVAESM